MQTAPIISVRPGPRSSPVAGVTLEEFMRRLSVSQAASELSVSDSTVRRRIKRGELRALRELVDARTRVWVILGSDDAAEEVATVDAVSEALAAVAIPTPIAETPPSQLVAEPERTRQIEPLVFERPEPPQTWLTGWALRTPRNLEWVAPSGAGEPLLTLRLAEARVHRTEQLARTYASWLPIEVEAMPVAVGA